MFHRARQTSSGVRLRNALPHNGFFLGNQLHHFGFNRSEVSLFNHRFARVYIVIEPVLDSRSDAELDSRIQFLQASASKCALVCQNACFPSSSSHL